MTIQRTQHSSLAILFCLLLTLAGCVARDDSAMGQIDAARGDWVVINYWAEWCKPCIKEVPELNTLDAREDVTVLGVNFDGAEGDALADQIEKLAITFVSLPDDPSTALGVARPEVLPTSLVINPAGDLVATLVGPQTLDTLLAATVNRSAQQAGM